MKALKKLALTTVKLLVFAGLAAGVYYGYQAYAVDPDDAAAEALPTAVATVRDVTVSVSATGVLQPIKIVEIKSKASGEILEMPVEMGDYLDAGALIAQVDTRILDQELKQAQADFESADVRLDISRRQLDRANSLHSQDLISETDLETSKQNFSNAESQFIRAEASLELAKERLADTTVTAPISGTVIAKSVEQGQIIASSTNNVSGGTILLLMADLSELEIRTLVDEIDIGNVKPGLRVESTVEAYADMRFEGEVMKIEPQAVVQQSVTTFPVLSRIDNRRGLLLPGMNADVSIIIHQRRGVLTVATEAIRSPSDAREVIELLGLEGAIAAPRAAATAAGVPVPAAEPHGQAAMAADGDGDGDVADGDGDGESAAGSYGHGADRENGHGVNGGYANGEGSFDGNGSSPDADHAAASMRRTDDQARRDPGVVFVLRADGRMEPREIVTGVRDWEAAEVLSGLEAGEEVVLLPSNSLLRSQQSARQRFARRNAVIPDAGR